MSISIHYHTVPNNMFQPAILEFLNPVMLAEKEYEIFTINKSSSLPFGMLPRFKQPNSSSKIVYKTICSKLRDWQVCLSLRQSRVICPCNLCNINDSFKLLNFETIYLSSDSRVLTFTKDRSEDISLILFTDLARAKFS
jgi:hypothetical protein